MNEFCMWSIRAYEALIQLFPDELRTEFGAEMREAFEEDLKLESSLRGVNGALRVWRIAFLEVIRIALPAWFRNPLLAVPLLSGCTNIVLQTPVIIVRICKGSCSPLLGVTLVTVAVEAALTMLTAFVAVYPWKFSRTITLSLR